MNLRLLLAAVGLSSLLSLPAGAHVVINEIFYHAPQDLTELQWVELFNNGNEAVDLKGWSLAKGIKFHFPAGTRLAPGAFLVVSRNAAVFQQAYGKAPSAVFEKTLKPKGEQIDLKNAAGEVVDSVKFADRSPWPVEADGHSASLERICPTAPGNSPNNWAASPVIPNGERPGGTPGATNSVYQATLPPVIDEFKFGPGTLAPGTPVPLEARIDAPAGVRTVAVLYRVLTAGAESPEKRIPLTPGATGRYTGSLPGAAAPPFGVIRLRVEAIDAQGAVRSLPAAHSLRPAFSILVHTNVTPGKIPLAWVLNPSPGGGRQNRNGEWSPEDQLRWAFQTKFRNDADLYTLWSGLALTNALETGQMGKLHPIFLTQFSDRNERVRAIIDAESLTGRDAAVDATIRSFRSNTAALLRPHLNPAQAKWVALWQAGPPAAASRGFDPELMLKSWVNFEMQFFAVTLGPNASAEKFPRLREFFQQFLEQRNALREPAKTAFTDDASRQAFQEKVEKLHLSFREKLTAILSEPELESLGKIVDEAMLFRQPRKAAASETAVHGRSALIWADSPGGAPQLYDFVEVVDRKAGWKVHLHRDQPLRDMTVVNLIYEFNDRFVLAEPLAFDFYRRAGNAASLVDFVRLQVDSQPLGYHLVCEQPNKAFLRRNHLRDDGNLYKLGWQGQTLTELYEKKTQPATGHTDLEELIQQLGATQGRAQWDVIRRHFHVEQVMTYFAVNSLLAHWDGFMNNHFAYHDVNGTGKWELYPWDQDKAMGFHDVVGENAVFATLPMNYGAAGDTPPGWGNRPPPKTFFETIRRPGMEWWRPPGYMSGPLLANPDFRRLYAARIKELLGTEFSEAKMHVAINAMGERVREEVRVRAQLRGEDPQSAMAQLDHNLESLRRFVTERRAFLLAQKEIQTAPAFDRTLLK